MSLVHSSYVCSIIHESLTKGWLPVILLQFQEKLRISIMSTNLENCHNYSNILLGANSFSYFIISQVFSNYYVTIYFGCLSAHAQCNLGDHPSPAFSSVSLFPSHASPHLTFQKTEIATQNESRGHTQMLQLVVDPRYTVRLATEESTSGCRVVLPD